MRARTLVPVVVAVATLVAGMLGPPASHAGSAFAPTLSVSLGSTTAGAATPVTVEFRQAAREELPKSVVLDFPAGWQTNLSLPSFSEVVADLTATFVQGPLKKQQTVAGTLRDHNGHASPSHPSAGGTYHWKVEQTSGTVAVDMSAFATTNPGHLRVTATIPDNLLETAEETDAELRSLEVVFRHSTPAGTWLRNPADGGPYTFTSSVTSVEGTVHSPSASVQIVSNVSLSPAPASLGSPVTVNAALASHNQNPGAVETISGTIFSTRDPAGFGVTLTETGQDTGVFRKQITLSPKVTDSGASMLKALELDRITARVSGQGGSALVAEVFSDDTGLVHEPNILAVWKAGITGGCATKRYCPFDGVTRGQMATFLARALGLPAATQDYFSDDGDSPHHANINKIAEAGIAGGCATGKYCPNRIVNRAEMATFLVRALGLPATSTDHFDDDGAFVHEPNINALAEANITGGCGTRAYCPAADVLRAEMATFLTRGLGLV